MPGFGSSEKMIIEGNAFGKYGMPSSHTQFMFFFATCIPLFFAASAARKNQNFSNHLALLQFVSYVCATMVAYSRVHFEYHTYSQVFVGALVGIALGVAWTWLYKTVIEKSVIPAIANSSIAKKLGIVSKKQQMEQTADADQKQQ